MFSKYYLVDAECLQNIYQRFVSVDRIPPSTTLNHVTKMDPNKLFMAEMFMLASADEVRQILLQKHGKDGDLVPPMPEAEMFMEALEFFSYTASAEDVRQILVQKYGDLVPPMPDLVRWLYEMKEVVIGMMEKADSIDWDEEIKRKRRLRINKIKDFYASYEEENK